MASDDDAGQGPTRPRSRLSRMAQQDAFMRALFDDAAYGIMMTGRDGRVRECNETAAAMLGFEIDAIVGQHFNGFTHAEDASIGSEQMRALIGGAPGPAEFEKRYLHRDGSIVWVRLSVAAIRDADGEVDVFVTYIDDITGRKAAERERVEMQAALLEAHREALRELSTPLIPIAAHVIALPLVGPMSVERVEHAMTVVLDGVSTHRARTVIIDITGVPSLEPEVATRLLGATRAIRLLGAETLLAGLRPDVALSLTALDVELGGLRTAGNFASALALALGR